jgi:hypothetical protein
MCVRVAFVGERARVCVRAFRKRVRVIACIRVCVCIESVREKVHAFVRACEYVCLRVCVCVHWAGHGNHDERASLACLGNHGVTCAETLIYVYIYANIMLSALHTHTYTCIHVCVYSICVYIICVHTVVGKDERAGMCCAAQQIGRTPLISASVSGHSEVVGALLAKGADVEAKDEVSIARDGLSSWLPRLFLNTVPSLEHSLSIGHRGRPAQSGSSSQRGPR